MTAASSSSDDSYAHLRKHATAQKQETVDRLARAITKLEADGRPVTTFTIREVSGLDYMAYYRNRAAFQLFQEHSTHLRKKREQEQAKRQAASRSSKKRKKGKTENPFMPSRFRRVIRCWITNGQVWSNFCMRLVLNVTKQNGRRE